MPCSFQGPRGPLVSPLFGGDSEGATPLPIPNRAVKPLSADGTWDSRPWESRSPPVLIGPPTRAARFRSGRRPRLRALMSVLAIVLIVVAVVILLVLAGGYAATRRRARGEEGTFEDSLAAADRALEEARADDKGWDRALLEEAARKALADARPGWTYDDLHLVLVDDRPGVEEDRAQFLAVGGEDRLHVALARR